MESSQNRHELLVPLRLALNSEQPVNALTASDDDACDDVINRYVTLCHTMSSSRHDVRHHATHEMVKRSRSAAQLPSDDHVELVLDTIDPQMIQERPEARGAELIEDGRRQRAAPMASVSSSTSTNCALGESKQIKPAQANNQLRSRTLVSSMVAAANVEPPQITISVQMLSGPLPPITISAGATVRDLKLHLQSLNASFEFDCQKLLIRAPDDAGAGILLLNHRSLQSYEITDSSNVVLVMLPSSEIEVWIDEAMNDTNRFNELLTNQDLHATAMRVGSICSLNQALLFHLFSENCAIQSVKIGGCWIEEHLEFCRALLTERPDLDIRIVVEGTSESMVLQIVEFCKVSHCSYLDLGPENLGRARLGELAFSLQSMSSLQTLCLDLKKNHLGKRFCRTLSAALQSMFLLHTVELYAASIDASGVEVLAPALSSLHTLVLWISNGIANKVCIALSALLQSIVSLHTLSLSFNEIDYTGFIALAPALKSMSLLQSLDLNNNEIGDEECCDLATALQSMTLLQTLNLSSNSIDDEGCVVLAPALRLMASLQTLNLSGNKIGEEGCCALAPAMQSMPYLQTLDLCWNKIDAAGCAALAPELALMSSLQTLNLYGNDFGAAGCAALAPALRSIPSLRMLGLGGAFIGSEGCVALAHALKSMSSLLELDLGYNQIGYKGCIALAPALQSMSSLQKLSLSFNEIDAAGCVALISTLQSMGSLLTLDLGHNQINIQVEEALRWTLSSQSLHLQI